jgi:hypothetical protein
MAVKTDRLMVEEIYIQEENSAMRWEYKAVMVFNLRVSIIILNCLWQVNTWDT